MGSRYRSSKPDTVLEVTSEDRRTMVHTPGYVVKTVWETLEHSMINVQAIADRMNTDPAYTGSWCVWNGLTVVTC